MISEPAWKAQEEHGPTLQLRKQLWKTCIFHWTPVRVAASLFLACLTI